MDDASLISGIRDFYLLLIIPVVAYWLSASIFHLFDCQRWFQAYKIHSPEDEQKRNRATLGQVFRQVLAQQVVQVVFALLVDRALNPSPNTDGPAVGKPSMPKTTTWVQARAGTPPSDGNLRSGSPLTSSSFRASMGLTLQFACAILIADFWQYSWHRVFHSNKLLYKYIHSVHHRLYVPYSYGALYSSLVEAFIVDTIGTTITISLSGLSVLPATWFTSLSIINNTTEFHDVHHQNWGMKYNYSQIYLTVWDDLLGTTMPPEEVAKRHRGKADVGKAEAKREKTE